MGPPPFTPQIVIPGWTAGGDVLFPQKGFTYDFEFLHAFLSNRKNKIYHKQMGGGHPPLPPKSSFLGGQQAECVRYG